MDGVRLIVQLRQRRPREPSAAAKLRTPVNEMLDGNAT